MKYFIFITLLTALSVFSVKSKGSDSTSCICPMTYEPVCASNQITYPNQCSFNCAQVTQPDLTIFTQGECSTLMSIDNPEVVQNVADGLSILEEPDRCTCPMNYLPVCGTDLKTYENVCVLNCARQENPALGIAVNGECPKEGVGAVPVPQMKPIPFRAKRNNDNFCLCTREYRPVCGSDGVKKVTYANECEFKCAHNSNPALKIVTSGPC